MPRLALYLLVPVLFLAGQPKMSFAKESAPRPYRLSDQLEQEEIPTSAITFAPDGKSSAPLLLTLHDQLKDKIRDSGYVQADETPIKVLDPDRGGKAAKILGAATAENAKTEDLTTKGKTSDKLSADGLPLKPTRTIEFTTTEGTQMSVDVSADGRTVVFDLLGDLYTVPIAGGRAQRLTEGLAWDRHPRFSPDGRQIAFVSDRSGTENVWIMDVSARSATNVTSEHDVYAFTQPIWMPDGRSLLTRRDIGDSDDPQQQLWRYSLQGGPAAGVLPADVGYLSGGAPFPDGKRVVFVSQAGIKVRALGLQPTQNTVLVPCAEQDGACNFPLVSPDGRWLVYAQTSATKEAFFETRASLYLRDLQSPNVAALPLGIQVDVTLSSFVPSAYAFTADSRSLVVATQGKLQHIDLATRQSMFIPFEAEVRAHLGPLARFPQRLDDGELQARQIRAMHPAPDGSAIAFSALGKIWRMDNGKRPERLTDSTLREGDPVYSPDGRWIAYVTWSDGAGGQLWKVSVAGGKPIALTQAPGLYLAPRWLPDSSGLVFVYKDLDSAFRRITEDYSDTRRARTREQSLTEYERLHRYGLASVAAQGGVLKILTPGGVLVDMDFASGEPSLAVRAGRAYFLRAVGGKTIAEIHQRPTIALVSIGLAQNDERTEALLEPRVVAHNLQAIPSPDGRWLALQERYNVSVMPFPASTSGAPPVVKISGPERDAALIALTATGGLGPVWTADSRYLQWSWGADVFRTSVQTFEAGNEATPQKTLSIGLRVRRNLASGSRLLRGARIVTFTSRAHPADASCLGVPDAGVLERGDILITGRRIVAVGPSGSLQVPAGTPTLEVSGMTIVPGFVDLLGNVSTGHFYLLPQRGPISDATLAYGITTNYGSGSETEGSAAAELLEAGELRGPREVLSFIWSSPAFDTNNPLAIDRAMQLFKQHGRNIYKSRETFGHRYQRQWLIQSAGRERMTTTFHQHNMALMLQHVLDGYGMIIHNMESTPLYHDVIELLARSGTAYNMAPTRGRFLRRTVQDAPHKAYWREGELAEDNRKLYGPTETSINQPKGLFEDAHRLMCAGAIVGTGTDGLTLAGLSVHQSYWNLAFGGFAPVEILRAATLNNIRALGLEADLGSIEPGKIADLAILSKNPLENIRNTQSTRYVVKDGIVYDAETLERLP